MPAPVISVLTFVWTYVIPVIKDIAQVLSKGTYSFIKDKVDDADILTLGGIEKRTRVYELAVGFLEEKNIDPSLYSSAAIYLLIEIAVVNLKKKQKKLVKTNN